MKNNQYKCAMCKGIFDKGWSDEEVMQEASWFFGEELVNNSAMDVVCDDCFQKINPANHPIKVEKTKQEFFSNRNLPPPPGHPKRFSR